MVLTANSSVMGGAPQRGVADEETRKQQCQDAIDCSGIDWNFTDSPYIGVNCWHHHGEDILGEVLDNINANHWAKECESESGSGSGGDGNDGSGSDSCTTRLPGVNFDQNAGSKVSAEYMVYNYDGSYPVEKCAQLAKSLNAWGYTYADLGTMQACVALPSPVDKAVWTTGLGDKIISCIL